MGEGGDVSGEGVSCSCGEDVVGNAIACSCCVCVSGVEIGCFICENLIGEGATSKCKFGGERCLWKFGEVKSRGGDLSMPGEVGDIIFGICPVGGDRGEEIRGGGEIRSCGCDCEVVGVIGGNGDELRSRRGGFGVLCVFGIAPDVEEGALGGD